MVYRGASEVKFFIRLHTFVWFVRRLVDNFKGMVIRWRRRRNVSCGSVANIRENVVNVEGTNTLEES